MSGTCRRTGQKNMFRSLLEGFRLIRTSKVLKSLMWIALVCAFCGVPINLLLPVFAQDVYGLGAGGYGFMGLVLGVGAVLGALIVAAVGNAPQKGRNWLNSQFLLGLAMLGFAIATNFWFGIATLFVCGGAILGVFTMITSLVQLNVTDEMRGRIMSVHNTAFRGAMPLSNLVCGFVAERIGADNVLSINAMILIAVAGWYMVTSNQVRDL